ncbi:Transcription factor GATA-5 [Entophlyctis sp. JEL0112]|nr:Transcription factor GATA-5 [Entophlyctis sp. JEL0112]
MHHHDQGHHDHAARADGLDLRKQQLVVASDGRCIGADQRAAYEYLLALRDSLAADHPHDPLCDCGCRVPRAVSAAAASTPTSPAPSAAPFVVHHVHHHVQLPAAAARVHRKAPRLLLPQPHPAAPPVPVPVTTRKQSAIAPDQCTNCRTTKTSTWRRDSLGRLICNACKLYLKAHGASRPLTQRKEVISRRSRCGKDLARAILLQHIGSASAIASPSPAPSVASPVCKLEE